MHEKRKISSLRKAQAFLFCIAVFLTPLCFFPFIHQQFIWSKIALIETFAGLVFLLAVIRLARGETLRVDFGAVGLFAAALLLWHLLLWPFAESHTLASDRIALMLSVGVLAWFGQRWLCHPNQRRQRLLALLNLLACAAVIVSLWALLQDIFSQFQIRMPILSSWFNVGQNYLGDWRGAITASFGNTDFIAAFLATLYLPILLLYLYTFSRLRTVLLGMVLFIMTSALIVCWSVGANGALILSSLIVIAMLGPRRMRYIMARHTRRFFIWMALCVLSILWFVTPNPLNPHAPGIFQQAFSSERWIAGGPTRWVIWLNTLSIIQENPVLGVGPGNFTYAYPRQDSALIPQTMEWQKYTGSYTNAAHNAVLQMWAETGPLGATLLILLVVTVLHRFFIASRSKYAEERARPLDAVLAAGLAGSFLVLCLDGMMTFPLQLPTLLFMFFAIVAASSLLSRRHENVVDIILPIGRSKLQATSASGRWGECRFALKDMRRPVALDIRLQLPAFLKGLLITLALMLLTAFMVWSWRLIVADYYFLPAKQNFTYMNMTGRGNRALAQETLHYSLKAARIAPRHHDAQGVAGQMYLELGQPDKALEMFRKVFKRLDSREYYLYTARALQAMGREEDARLWLSVFQERQPLAGLPGPAQSQQE